MGDLSEGEGGAADRLSDQPRSSGRRRGVTRDGLVAVALAIVDEEPEAFTLAEVARRLDVRLPTLYSHVEGLAALKQLMRLELTRRRGRLMDLAAAQCAAEGRSGPETVHAVFDAVRADALAHPGQWLTTTATTLVESDPEFRAAAATGWVVVEAIIAALGVAPKHLEHCVAVAWSLVTGYLGLEIAVPTAAFTDAAFATTVEDLMAMLVDRYASSGTPRRTPRPQAK